MFSIFYFEFALHAVSMVTATVVVLKILFYDKIDIPAKLCICLIYSSAYVTDISYSFAVYQKMLIGQMLFRYGDILLSDEIEDREALRMGVFCHEMGTWIYVWGVLLTASERLLRSYFNIKLKCNCWIWILSPFVLCLIAASSYFCTTLLVSAEHIFHTAIFIVCTQIFGISALVYTLYLNRQSYEKGLGQCLEQRYQSSYDYRFNCSLLKSLLGEVFCRLAAFSCILIISTGVYDDVPFGWLSFTYHNLIPVGSIAFPWFIVLRHVKIDWRKLFCGKKKTRTAVRDLHGNDLAMTMTAEEHFAALERVWK